MFPDNAFAQDADPLRRLAFRRAGARLGFVIHLLAYLLVNAVQIGWTLATDPANTWYVWPALGWGMGVASHGLVVLAFLASGAGWREPMIQGELKRMRRHP